MRQVAVRSREAVWPDLVIFDCDGVLVDSDRISLRIQAEHLRHLGLRVSYDDCVRDFLGIGMPATLRILGERLGHPVPDWWLTDLDQAVRSAFQKELTPIPGIERALDAITAPTCVASSGSQQKMRFTLGRTGLYERFAGRIFSADEVKNGKPAPDLFLHAAHEMNAIPTRCVVIEDSPAGVSAAKAAGMYALGYAVLTPADRLAAADAIFTDMTALPSLILQAAEA
jgi:HAD superfamily hydrolase (TIGR01509 family)